MHEKKKSVLRLPRSLLLVLKGVKHVRILGRDQRRDVAAQVEFEMHISKPNVNDPFDYSKPLAIQAHVSTKCL